MRARRLDQFSQRETWTDRAGRLSDRAWRWMFGLDRAVNESVAVVGQLTFQLQATVAATFLSSADPLPGGTYRLTVALRGVSGADPTSVVVLRVELDNAGVDEGFDALRLDYSDDGGMAGWKTASAIRVLATGTRIGYSVAYTDLDGTPYVVDGLLVVELLPPTTRLGL